MSFIVWTIIGLLSGFIGSKMLNNAGERFILDMFLGMLGAVAGGLLFQWVASIAMDELSLQSAFVAVVGAIAVLWIKNTIVRRKSVPM